MERVWQHGRGKPAAAGSVATEAVQLQRFEFGNISLVLSAGIYLRCGSSFASLWLLFSILLRFLLALHFVRCASSAIRRHSAIECFIWHRYG